MALELLQEGRIRNKERNGKEYFFIKAYS